MKARLNLVQLRHILREAETVHSSSGVEVENIILEVEVVPLHQVAVLKDEEGNALSSYRSFGYIGELAMGEGIPNYEHLD